MLPDELMGDSSLLAQMARLCESTGGSVVGLKRVPVDEVSSYGVIDPSAELDARGVVGIRTMVEKPTVEDAPSDLIIIGRYVLTPDVFDEIERVQPGSGGEIQLTDALRAQAANGPVPRRAVATSAATTPALRSAGSARWSTSPSRTRRSASEFRGLPALCGLS